MGEGTSSVDSSANGHDYQGADVKTKQMATNGHITETKLDEKQTAFGVFVISKSSKIASLFTHHDFLNAHKILGIACLVHYFLRFYWLIFYGDMFFRPDSWLTWVAPAMHVTLSMSSFIFPVPLHRFGTKPIIWKELQLHNILFTSRSAVVFYLQLWRPCFSSHKSECGMEHFTTRFLLVVILHYFVDRVTDSFQDRGRTTTRDMPWDEGTPEWLMRGVKKYYAVCQVVALCALLCQGGNQLGQGILEGSFAIMFPIQISTFLMTLVRKNILTGSQWHLWYALSLGIIYAIPIVETLRNRYGPNLDGFQMAAPTSATNHFLKLLFAPTTCMLRLTFNVNKYIVMALMTGSVISLSVM